MQQSLLIQADKHKAKLVRRSFDSLRKSAIFFGRSGRHSFDLFNPSIVLRKANMQFAKIPLV